MLDLLKARGRYTEPEARFYLVQLIGACNYMHSNLVIHRDLKLGNLMVDAAMNLRVGDFGLAALVKPGERRKTICGTPNYIAPEILFDQDHGHSFEVDIWSLGVILYTLLVGKPPFQTSEVKNIYRKIRENKYEFPANVRLSTDAVDLIQSILASDPSHRPTLADILAHPFMTSAPFPSSLPVSSRTFRPAFDHLSPAASARNYENALRHTGLGPLVAAAQQSSKSASDFSHSVFSALDQSSATAVASTSSAAAAVPARAPFDAIDNLAGRLRKLEVVGEEPDEEARVDKKHAPSPALLKNRSPAAAQAAESDDEDAAKEKQTKSGLEKEVREALQPSSPISQLLRSARKPLMVSPKSPQQQQQAREHHQPMPTGAAAAIAAAEAQSDDYASPTRKASERTAAAATTLSNSKLGASVNGQQQRPAASSAGAALAAVAVMKENVASRQADAQGYDGNNDAAAALRRSASIASRVLGSSRAENVDSLPAADAHLPTKMVDGVPHSRLGSRGLYQSSFDAITTALSVRVPSDIDLIPSAPTPPAPPTMDGQPAGKPKTEGPRVFIASWVDYTHKYGTAYALTDGSTGVYFNDSTTMIVSPNNEHFDYIACRKGNVYGRRHYKAQQFPTDVSDLKRKRYLVEYFNGYIDRELKRDVPWTFIDDERTRNMDFLVKYYRLKQAIAFKLSNDVLQVRSDLWRVNRLVLTVWLQFNFYDHNKIILTHSATVITFINTDFVLQTFSLQALFRTAARLGYFGGVDPARLSAHHREKLELIRGLIQKLEYIRDVLHGLVYKKDMADF